MFFNGFGNYRMVFEVTPFVESFNNTILLAFSGTLLQFIFGMLIALILFTHLPGVNFVRIILIMPVTIAPIVAGFLFRYLYEPQGGLLIWLAGLVNISLPKAGLLGDPSTSLLAIGLADSWQWTPFFAIILYAGLLALPSDIIEAAKVDGANRLQVFFYIQLPLLKNISAFLIMIRFMQLFNSFDLVYVLTNGGPGTSSRTLSYNLYQEGLVNYNIGTTAAMTWVMVLIVTIIINVFILIVYRKS